VVEELEQGLKPLSDFKNNRVSEKSNKHEIT